MLRVQTGNSVTGGYLWVVFPLERVSIVMAHGAVVNVVVVVALVAVWVCP